MSKEQDKHSKSGRPVPSKSGRDRYFPELQKRVGELDEFRLLVEFSTEAIFWVESETDTVIDVNRSACDLCKYNYDQFIGISITSVFDRQTYQSIKKTDSSGKKGKNSSGISTGLIVTSESKKIQVKYTISQSKASQPDYFVIIAHDISDELSDRNAILQASMDAYLSFDARGRIIGVNDMFCRLSGYSQPELLSKSLDDLLLPHKSNRIELIYKDPEKNRSHKISARHRTRDGRLFDVKVSTRYSEIAGGRIHAFIRKLVEGKTEKAEILSDEKILRDFVEHTPAAVAMFDNQMRYLLFSRRWLTDYNLEDQNILGKSHYMVFPDIPERWKKIHQRCLQGNIESCEEDLFMRDDGSEVFIKWEIHPWYTQDDSVGGIVMFTEVITERVLAKQALEKQAKFERLMTDISNSFINLNSDRFDQTIISALKSIAEFTDSEYCVIHQVEKSSGTEQITHTWSPENSVARLRQFEYGARHLFGQNLNSIENSEIIYKESSDCEKLTSSENDKHNSMCWYFLLPMITYGNLVGALGLYSFSKELTWKKDDLSRLKILAEIISNAFEHYRHEQELLNSEQRFRAIADYTYDWENWIGTDGRLKWINPTGESMTGYSAEECMAMNDFPLEMVHADDRDIIRRVLSEANHGISGNDQEFRIITKSGEIRWVAVSWKPIISADGSSLGYRSSIRDINTRKQSEKLLYDSERKYRELYENMREGSAAVDMKGWIIDSNPAFRRLVGYTKDELAKLTYEDLTPARWHEKEKRILNEQVMVRGYSEMYEKEYITKFGKIVPIELQTFLLKNGDGSPRGMWAVVRDISKRKETDEVINAERERLAVTLYSIGEGVITTDTRGTIFLINKAAEDLVGYKTESAVGQPLTKIFNILDVDSRKKAENPIESVLQEQVIVQPRKDVVLISRDKSEYVISICAAPIRDAHFKIVGVVISFRDITETRRLQKFASRAQRLEAAGRIAGQVAHDFNNLLAPMQAYPDLIKEQCSEDDRIYQYANEIERAASQMLDINQQLLTLGRRGHYALKIININEIINSAILSIQSLPQNLEVKTNLIRDIWKIRGSAAQILRAIVNLIVNARDAMEENGSLIIETNNISLKERTGSFFTIPTGEYVRIDISDSGPGIDQSIMHKIFDPFFTTKSPTSRSGSGLGLSVVHSVMEDHRGYVDCNNDSDNGTTFSLYFPRSESDESTSNFDQIYSGNERIVIVSDGRNAVETIMEFLKNLGYDALSIKDIIIASDLLSNEEKNYDMVVFDSEGFSSEDIRKFMKIFNSGNFNLPLLTIGSSPMSQKDDRLSDRDYPTAFISRPLSLKSMGKTIRDLLDRVSK